MKVISITCFFMFFVSIAITQAQSNSFPTTGNVGIGTTKPTKKLDVIGAVKVDELNFPAVHYDFSLAPRTQLKPMSMNLFDDYKAYRPGGESPGNNQYGTLLALYGRTSHWQTDIYFGASSKKMYFRTSAYQSHVSDNGVGGFHHWRTVLDSHSDVESAGKLAITGSGNHYIANGNVGIGTTKPSEKLAVNGVIRAKEIKVEAANWPDYVFQPDYILRPLADVEAFIEEHGHLPDVPHAAAIDADGLSLGEMNKILLKKIEELTLHLIEKEHSLKSLDNRVLQLEALLKQ